jgi:hypothetical protein
MSQSAVQIQTPGGRVVIGTGSAAVTVPGPSRLVIVGAAQGIAGATGISAYASYVATTDDDPILSEAQWAASAAENLNLDNHFGTLDDPSVIIDGGLL